MVVPLRVHLILLLAQLCFAALPVAGRLVLHDGSIAPGVIVMARVAGGAAVFTFISWQRGTLHLARRDILPVIGCALLGVVGNQELFIHGLARSTATNATVLGSTIPVFTALIAIALGREPVKLRRLAGIGVAFAGAAALVGADRVSLDADHVTGSVMVLLNALSYGSYLVAVRSLAGRYDPLGLVAWLFVAALPFVTPIGIVEAASAPPLGTTELLYLAFMIAVPTVGAYGLVQIALRHAESSLVASYIYLQPVFATLGAMLLLDEEPTLRTAACGAIVLFGVWLAAARRAR